MRHGFEAVSSTKNTLPPPKWACSFYDENSIETRNKMSKSHLGKKHSDESIQKMCNKKVSVETRTKMSIAKTGSKLPSRSIEHCIAISIAKTGKKNKLETNQKISTAMKGRKFSDEHKQKLREARLKYLRGE